jgi:hypothetical protein
MPQSFHRIWPLLRAAGFTILVRHDEASFPTKFSLGKRKPNHPLLGAEDCMAEFGDASERPATNEDL